MISKIARIGLLASAVALAGCTESTLESAIGAKANKELPARVLATMKAKDMPKNSPVMARIFKEEGTLEVWKQKSNGRYDLIASYEICKWSGQLGPKFLEGDRQAPEGFYTVGPSQLNPRSSYHLAFNMGFPNAFDRAHGRTGSHLMVHGGCSSSGCYSMTDEQVEEIYAFARDAFRGGQREFQIQAFPFRMTPENMARYRNDPNYPFWTMLKEGYDHFEITKVPPKVDVCEKRYVFNQVPEAGGSFSPTGACPPMSQPGSLITAYQAQKSTFETAFASYAEKPLAPPLDSIAGIAEAKLVADWTQRRARGERVPVEPPAMTGDGVVVASTERMGRIDSPAGRRQAAIDAAEAERVRIAEERAAAEAQRRAEAEAARVAAAQLAEQAQAAAAAPAAAVPTPSAATEAQEATGEAAPPPQAAEGGGLFGTMRKRVGSIGNLFGS
jgi:murein L,D-transpeptidase YafK